MHTMRLACERVRRVPAHVRSMRRVGVRRSDSASGAGDTSGGRAGDDAAFAERSVREESTADGRKVQYKNTRSSRVDQAMKSSDIVDELVMMRERARPPVRDAGIASETDWGISIRVDNDDEVGGGPTRTMGAEKDQGQASRRTKGSILRQSQDDSNGAGRSDGVSDCDGSQSPADGEGEDWVCEIEGAGWWWRKRGVDHGESGYRCRWTAMGGVSDSSTDDADFASIRAMRDENRLDAEFGFSWKETWWEKADWNGCGKKEDSYSRCQLLILLFVPTSTYAHVELWC